MKKNLKPNFTKIQEYSVEIEKQVEFVEKTFSLELEKVMAMTKEILDTNYTDEDLDKILLSLSTELYYLGAKLERVGIREDVAKMIASDKYNDVFLSLTEGTNLVKQSQAEQESIMEQLAYISYSRAYKTLKLKYESGNELLNSIKKVMTRRLSEKELVRGS